MKYISITGHRILAELDKIKIGVEQAYQRIEQRFPGELFTLYSPLAEGADSLAAGCAFEHGWQLVVPLPLPREDYLTDFTSAEVKQAFLTLLGKASQVIELPLQPTRNQAYDAVGRYVLEGCDVLVAIWDGQGAQGQGGTGEIVALARAAGKPLAWIHAGNRKPGTVEPTSLGKEQGLVSFEGF